MDFQHDLGGCFQIAAKKLLNHKHHELHRGVIVIQHHHLVQLGRFGSLGAPL
jgi:hypothetical protein